MYLISSLHSLARSCTHRRALTHATPEVARRFRTAFSERLLKAQTIKNCQSLVLFGDFAIVSLGE